MASPLSLSLRNEGVLDAFQSGGDWQSNSPDPVKKKKSDFARAQSWKEGRRRDHLTIVTFGRASPQSRYFREREGGREAELRSWVTPLNSAAARADLPCFQRGRSFCVHTDMPKKSKDRLRDPMLQVTTRDPATYPSTFLTYL